MAQKEKELHNEVKTNDTNEEKELEAETVTDGEQKEPEAEAVTDSESKKGKPKRKIKKSKDEPKREKSVKARLGVSALAIVMVLAIIITVLSIRFCGTGNDILEEYKTPKYLRDQQMNILICGIDDEAGRDEINTDLIMVANFDLEKHTSTILQIPRDTYVGETLVYTGKMNALYSHGYKDNPKDLPGIVCLVETINKHLQIPIDNYVLITMEGFREAVNIMGGIEITIDSAITTTDGDVVFEPGTHLLDGNQADLFVRFREGYAMQDIDRMKAQRYFMSALMEKLTSLSKLELASLINQIYPYLETDLKIGEVISFANEAKKLEKENISMIMLPGEPVHGYGIYGVDVWSLHKKETADVLNKYMRPYGDKVPETDLELIELQNTVPYYDESWGTMDNY